MDKSVGQHGCIAKLYLFRFRKFGFHYEIFTKYMGISVYRNESSENNVRAVHHEL